MGLGASACWGSDIFTLGADLSTLGVSPVASGKRTLGYCTAAAGLCTLGGGVVGSMRDFGIFPRFTIFGVAL